MTYRLMILGCGSSGGVPRLGPTWGDCDPLEPKNRRRRCSVLFERCSGKAVTSVLVDTSPDLRDQLLTSGITSLDAVLYTHDHADHTHGIDDLRMVAYAMKRRITIYADDPTRHSLTHRFGYCFETAPGSDYKPILTAEPIEPGTLLKLDGPAGPINALPLLQNHGPIASLGYRVANLAYSPDISDIPEATVAQLRNLDVWIVDALRYTPHPSHFHVAKALEWIARLRPKRTILTHMTSDLDYATLKRELPPGVEPAYDGMIVPFG